MHIVNVQQAFVGAQNSVVGLRHWRMFQTIRLPPHWAGSIAAVVVQDLIRPRRWFLTVRALCCSWGAAPDSAPNNPCMCTSGCALHVCQEVLLAAARPTVHVAARKALILPLTVSVRSKRPVPATERCLGRAGPRAAAPPAAAPPVSSAVPASGHCHQSVLWRQGPVPIPGSS